MIWLANLVLVLHALIVVFIVGGLIAIWIAAALKRASARNRAFRRTHLAASQSKSSTTTRSPSVRHALFGQNPRGYHGERQKADVLNTRTFTKLHPLLARTIVRTVEVNDVVFPG
jgi:hypothetical protein